MNLQQSLSVYTEMCELWKNIVTVLTLKRKIGRMNKSKTLFYIGIKKLIMYLLSKTKYSRANRKHTR